MKGILKQYTRGNKRKEKERTVKAKYNLLEHNGCATFTHLCGIKREKKETRREFFFCASA